MSESLNLRLVKQTRIDLDALLAELGTSTQGLSDAEAEELRKQHGLNEVEHEGPVRWWQHLWLSYHNPFNLLLTVLAAVSYFTHDRQSALVIGVLLPMGPLADYFKLQPLPGAYFLWLVGIIFSYAVLTSLMKRFYIRHHGWD